MTRALSLATALTLVTAATSLAGPAQAAGDRGRARLEVRSSVYRPDSDTITLTLRCVGTRRQCHGVLRTTVSEDVTRDATVPRTVTLPPGRMQTVTLAVAPHGLGAGDIAYGDGSGQAMLGPPGH